MKFLNWLNQVTKTPQAWKGNDLHIDEFAIFQDIQRDSWISTSFRVLDLISQRSLNFSNLVLFLHIGLTDSTTDLFPSFLDMEWLSENLDQFTPPSFNFTTQEYFQDFYLKNLNPVKFEPASLDFFTEKSLVQFYTRAYFNKTENSFFREVYVFLKK